MGKNRITRQLFEKKMDELYEQYNGNIRYYMESGMYRLYVNDKGVGEVMNLREAYKAIQVLEDILILVERKEYI